MIRVTLWKSFVSGAFAHWSRMRILNIQSEIKSLPTNTWAACTTLWLQYTATTVQFNTVQYRYRTVKIWLWNCLPRPFQHAYIQTHAHSHIPRHSGTWTDSQSTLQPQFILVLPFELSKEFNILSLVSRSRFHAVYGWAYTIRVRIVCLWQKYVCMKWMERNGWSVLLPKCFLLPPWISVYQSAGDCIWIRFSKHAHTHIPFAKAFDNRITAFFSLLGEHIYFAVVYIFCRMLSEKRVLFYFDRLRQTIIECTSNGAHTH